MKIMTFLFSLTLLTSVLAQEKVFCVRSLEERAKTHGIDFLDNVPYTPYGLLIPELVKVIAEEGMVYSADKASPLLCPLYIEKAPYIAWIGDSLSKDFHLSGSKLSDLSLARNGLGRNLFMDVDPTNKIKSFVEYVSEKRNVYAVNFSQAGSNIYIPLDFVDLVVIKKKSMGEQVYNLTQLDKFPHFVGIWIGHNDIDWKKYQTEGTKADDYTMETSEAIAEEYETQLEILVRAAGKASHKVGITVYSLGNMADFVLKALPEVERRHKMNPNLYYPASGDNVYELYNSLKAENRERLVEYFRMTSMAMDAAVLRVQKKAPKNVKIVLSQKLYEADFASTKFLHPDDGWHLSIAGKSELARRAFEGAKEALRFSGIIQ